MTDVSELPAIRGNPIGKGLDVFRLRFKSTCMDLGIWESQNMVEKLVSLVASNKSKSALLVVKFLTDVYRRQRTHA